MPTSTVNLVWDLFFLRGVKVLFQVVLTAFKLVEKEVYQFERFDEAMIYIQEYVENEMEPEPLFRNFVQIGPQD